MRHATVVALGFLLTAPAAAQTTFTLYDPTTGTLPAAQPWLTYADNAILTGGSASQSYVAGQGARLTTDAAVSAGYSNYLPFPPVPKNASFPVLDRTAGFSLSWTVQVHQESHTSADRAGFSTILLASDRRGIELGFWTTEVWAQEAGFTRAEAAVWDTGQRTDYTLTIQGDAYRLTGNGTSLLTGPLRDYSSSSTPYNLPSFLFLGDDTSSALADVTVGRVTVVSPVPEPAGLLAVGAALAWVVARRRGRKPRA
ncbi:MAG TPA: PEP-CTERM sorting domain-containing protein [Fimbriiglobus sp.]|nr:PEP-CTERM sorting domain-containing protein [Fimbriiglobus sp.]